MIIKYFIFQKKKKLNYNIYKESENISNILNEILTKYTNINGGKELIEHILNKKNLEILFKKISTQVLIGILFF